MIQISPDRVIHNDPDWLRRLARFGVWKSPQVVCVQTDRRFVVGEVAEAVGFDAEGYETDCDGPDEFVDGALVVETHEDTCCLTPDGGPGLGPGKSRRKSCNREVMKTPTAPFSITRCIYRWV